LEENEFMSDLRRFKMDIEGLTPLVMHSNAALMGPKEDKGRDPLQWERDHLLDMTYRDAAGRLVIPQRAIRKALINACRFVTDKPKGSSFKSFAPLVEAALFVEEDAVLDVSADKVLEYVAIVNLDPSKGPRGPRGPRCRPLIPLPWNAATSVTLIDDAMTGDHLSKVADAAGRLVGLLDARSIGMGRCSITVKVTRA
jgi:hypothetical protein